jgi:hypothetical protein
VEKRKVAKSSGSGSPAPNSNSLNIWIQAVYNSEKIFKLLQKLYTEVPTSTGGKGKHEPRLTSTTFLRPFNGLNPNQKENVLAGML